MREMKNARSKAGYDQEEAYFFERDRELIAKQREERPKLMLVKGGKQETGQPADPPGQIQQKKAA